MFFLSRSKKDKSIDMSIPQADELYGIKIVKLPVAKYIKVLNTLENLPQIINCIIFPENDSENIIAKLASGDENLIKHFFANLLISAPTEICKLISELFDIPLERMLDEKCSSPLFPSEITEILIKFWEKNDMTDFFVNVRKLGKMLTARKMKTKDTGFNVG